MIAFNAIHAEVTWTLSDGGVLTISGTSMPSYDNHAPWYAQREKIKIVIIENGVTNIGSYAFMDCSSLNSVTIPNSVTSIGDHAFDGTKWYTNQPNGVVYAGSVLYKYKGFMPANTNIVIKDGTTGISAAAFMNCSALSSVVIPNSVTNIGVYAFAYCNALTSIIIPNSVTNIGQYAFYNCNELVSISMSNSVTSIGDHAFDGTKWYEKYNNLIYMGAVLYKYKGTAANLNINIKDGTKSITNYAFYDCTGLKSVQIPNSMIDIGFWAFYRCSALTSIIIPNSVTNIGNYAFYGCSNLTTISISNSVTSIGDGTFYGCSGVTSVVIPESVTNIGKEAFSDCFSLTSISTENTITRVNAFYGTKWYDNQPDGLVYVGSALYKYKGTMSINSNINIKEGTKSITDYAFAECSGLTSITIPSSVNNIGEFTFHNCELLSKLTCNALTPPSLGYAAFYGTQYESGTLYVPASAISAYKTTSGWKKWKNILPIEDTTNAPTNISFANESEKIIVGKTIKLETTITPENATNKTITWTSTNTDVATVSSEGIVTAKGAGTTIITATTNNGKTAKCTITIEQPVTAITLSETTASLWVGKTKTLTATISPTTANNTTVNWSSSNNNVATVSSKGVITAKGKGTCTITCTAADGYGTKSTCMLTVKQQVNSIDFGYETLTMSCGEEKTLTPTINPSDADVKTLIWKSTDKSVATITSEGVLTAVSPGTTTITCTATDDFKKSSSITVIVESLDITITDKNPTIKEGTYKEGGISYTRTLTKNKYTTFCMPYDVNLSDYTDYFSNVYVPMEMAFVKSGGRLMVMFKSVSLTETIRAGQPFIVLASKSGTVAIKNSSKITITSIDEPQPTKLEVYNYGGNLLARNTDVEVQITGNYSIVSDLDDANNFTFSVNGQMVGATTVSPYRFYITKNDESSSAKITDIQLSFDGEEATGIEDIINEQKGDDKFYNLNGQRINKSNAQKGVYIKNGKKYAK